MTKPCSEFNLGVEFNNYGNRLALFTRLLFFFWILGVYCQRQSVLGRLCTKIGTGKGQKKQTESTESTEISDEEIVSCFGSTISTDIVTKTYKICKTCFRKFPAAVQEMLNWNAFHPRFISMSSSTLYFKNGLDRCCTGDTFLCRSESCFFYFDREVLAFVFAHLLNPA